MAGALPAEPSAGGRLSGVSSRRIALFALAAVALSGCATFENNDLVAMVGDAELSQSEFEQRARGLDEVAQASGQPSRMNDDRIAGDLARQTISSWIDLQLGAEADIIDAWLGGPTESGIGCIFFITTPDAATSDAWIDELRGGADWDTFVARSPFEAVARGRIPCFPTSELEPFVADQLDGMSADDPYRTVVFADATAGLARMQTLEELDGTELLAVAAFVEPASLDAVANELADIEVEVSALYGRFDATLRRVDPIG